MECQQGLVHVAQLMFFELPKNPLGSPFDVSGAVGG